MSQLRLKVVSADPVTDRIRTLVLVSADGRRLPGYQAGAHIRVSLPDGGERHYSLINTDTSVDTGNGVEAYRIGVLLEPESKGGSSHMHGLRPGDVVDVSAPKNDFPISAHAAPAVLIAGGIGVTPIISMAAELRRAGRPFEFHYSGRSRQQMAFVEEIEAEFGDTLSTYWDDDESRLLDLSALIAKVPVDAHVYVCGPRGMIEATREIALVHGIDRDNIHFELFEQAAEQVGDQPFEVVVKSTGDVFVVPPGKTIIDVLEAGGIDLVYDCQRGDCGICQTTVLEGIPDHRDVILTESERASNTVMQICVSRARSPRLVLDL